MTNEQWEDFVDAYEEQEELELAMAVSGMSVTQVRGTWWAVPADPGDPPKGYPFPSKDLAEEGVRKMAVADDPRYAKVVMPERPVGKGN